MEREGEEKAVGERKREREMTSRANFNQSHKDPQFPHQYVRFLFVPYPCQQLVCLFILFNLSPSSGCVVTFNYHFCNN